MAVVGELPVVAVGAELGEGGGPALGFGEPVDDDLVADMDGSVKLQSTGLVPADRTSTKI